MTSRRVTPLLLAASIFLTGATGAFIGSTTSAHAITSVDELTDVNHSHWAYDALRDLVEKYDVIEGYPDHTFRGERNATRWELAAALNALIKSVGRDLARLGAEKADKADLETLAKLQDEFKNELAALQARTDALESRASAIEAKNAEQDQRLTLLERTQIHGDASFGGFADINSRGTRQDGAVGGRDGIRDAISAVGRVRLTLDVPVKEDKEDSKIGAGEFHTRMIAAFGRISPAGAYNPANAGSFGSYNSMSRIASDAALANEGLGTSSLGGAGINGGASLRSSLYVENMHYHQHFKAGIPLLTDWMMGAGNNDKSWATTGDLYAGQIPWRYLFDKSPYRGNEQNQFQNSAFVNVPGVAMNFNMPMIAYQWHQKLGSDDLSADLTSGIGAVDVGNNMNGLNLTYEGRLNYNLAAHAGNFYAGGYNIWNNGSQNYNGLTVNAVGTTATINRAGQPGGSQRDVANGFYAGWNQEWYKGIGTTFNYLYNNKGASNFFLNANNQLIGASNLTTVVAPGQVGAGTTTGVTALGVRQSFSGVLSIPLKVFGVRENDVFGIGYALVDLYNDNIRATQTSRFKNVWEQTGEAYYKFAVNDAISIIPSVQFITHGAGIQANGLTTVIGLRTSYAF
jgi:hypothetical protein